MMTSMLESATPSVMVVVCEDEGEGDWKAVQLRDTEVAELKMSQTEASVLEAVEGGSKTGMASPKSASSCCTVAS